MIPARVFSSSIARNARAAAALVAIVVSLALPRLALAAHPLITEDSGTQGRGRFELENGFALTRHGGLRGFEYVPQLSYGALDNLDLIVAPTWLEQRLTASAGGGRERGPGDTVLDVKSRFFERDRLSFGTRAGIDLPTGNAEQGRGTDKVSVHALLIATIDVAPFEVHANAGYALDRAEAARRNRWQTSFAAVWSAHERAKLTLDVAAQSNSDPRRSTWPAVIRAGVIWTVFDGFDVDAGYQTRLNRAAAERIVLVGATLRW